MDLLSTNLFDTNTICQTSPNTTKTRLPLIYKQGDKPKGKKTLQANQPTYRVKKTK